MFIRRRPRRRGDRLKRREFIALVGGTVSLPVLQSFAVLAQTTRMTKIGFLILSNPEPYWSFFREAFNELGYVEGRNVELHFRSADGNPHLLIKQALEFVQAKADLLIAIQTPAVKAAMNASKDIPIVMAAGAPVETGLVGSLNRPGGNVTGMSTTGPELAAKTLEVLREALPALRKVAVLVNAADLTFGNPMLDQIRIAGKSLAIEVEPSIVEKPEDLELIFPSIVKNGAQAVIPQPSLPRSRTLELAIDKRIPAISPNTLWTRAGAFMSYAPDVRDVCRKAAGYADRILKGGKPADLPIEQPTKYELVINLKTAKAIGLSVTPSLLIRADEVIE